MPSFARFAVAVVATGVLAASSFAAEPGWFDPGPAANAERTSSDVYRQPTAPLTPTQIIQRRAQARAAQRILRMENAAAMGYSPARPPVTTSPFTTAPMRNYLPIWPNVGVVRVQPLGIIGR